MSAPAWYAIWTRSRHEQVVREQLEAKGLEAFLPTIAQVEPMEGSSRRRSTGRCSRATASRGSIPDERLPILKCAGVVSIVSFNGEIAPIPDQ